MLTMENTELQSYHVNQDHFLSTIGKVSAKVLIDYDVAQPSIENMLMITVSHRLRTEQNSQHFIKTTFHLHFLDKKNILSLE